MTICGKCQQPVCISHRYKVVNIGLTDLTGLEHVDCTEPTKGAYNPTCEQTVSPAGVTWRLSKYAS